MNGAGKALLLSQVLSAYVFATWEPVLGAAYLLVALQETDIRRVIDTGDGLSFRSTRSGRGSCFLFGGTGV